VAIERRGDTLAPVSVPFRTLDLGAVAGADYTAAAGTLVFAQGQRTAQVAIPVRQDGEVEGAEALALELGAPVGGAVTETPRHVVRLVDDDAAPTGTPPAPPDRDRPRILARPRPPASLAALRRAARLRVSVSCSEACAGRVTASLAGTRLGRRAFALRRAGVVTVTVRLGRKARRVLARAARRRGRATLRTVVEARDGAGNPGRDVATLRVRRR
jgi:Calx-beta domain